MIDACEYLMSINRAWARIQFKKQQLQSLEDQLLCLSVPMDKEQVSHTKNVGAMANTVAMIVDMQEEIALQMSEYVKAKSEAVHLLEKVNPDSATILTNRFFHGKTVQELGKDMYLTRRHAQRRLCDAIAAFQIVLNEHEKLSRSESNMQG